MPWSSNATFLVGLEVDGEEVLQAVYKPYRGERELWDFPDGLYRREVAAYVVSDFLGWRLVPETIVRHDLPFGTGSLQRFVDADFGQHYFTLLERPECGDALRSIAVFDILVNNADRKGGHCLIDDDGHVWGIDNGLCFHRQHKLRTVVWDFAGETVDDTLLDDVRRLAAAPPEALSELLHPTEVEAIVERAHDLVADPVLPEPFGHHPYPWPLV